MQNKSKWIWIVVIVLALFLSYVLFTNKQSEVLNKEGGESTRSVDNIPIDSKVKAGYKNYIVPGKFSFSYVSGAEVEIVSDANIYAEGGSYRVWSDTNRTSSEYVNYATDGSLWDYSSDMGTTFLGNQKFGEHTYKVYRFKDSDEDTERFIYFLLLPDKRAVSIVPLHGLDVPMTVDLASIEFE